MLQRCTRTLVYGPVPMQRGASVIALSRPELRGAVVGRRRRLMPPRGVTMALH